MTADSEWIREDDEARSLPGVIYHAACWKRRCAINGETGPALVVRQRPSG